MSRLRTGHGCRDEKLCPPGCPLFSLIKVRAPWPKKGSKIRRLAPIISRNPKFLWETSHIFWTSRNDDFMMLTIDLVAEGNIRSLTRRRAFSGFREKASNRWAILWLKESVQIHQQQRRQSSTRIAAHPGGQIEDRNT